AHQPPRIEAVPDDTGDEAEQHDRQELCERHRTGLHRRVRDGEREQRVRDRRGARPDRGEQLPALEQDEVAVVPQRCQTLRHPAEHAVTRMSISTAIGLVLALVSTTLTNVAYLREHDAAVKLPVLRLRRPLQSARLVLTD